MLNIGLIGWGYWGRNYAKYFGAHLGAELTMVCDLREDMLEDAKNAYPSIKTTKDIVDLAKAKLDGVIIASPASIHYKLASYLISEHIPLLIEKPLTNSYETSEQLGILSRKENVKVLVGHTFLYNQSVRFLKEQADSGRFGKLYYLEFRRQSYGPIRDDVNIVWDFAPHDIAISNYLLGYDIPISVYAKAEKVSRNDKEDIAVIVMKYPGNIMVNINVAWLYPIKIRSLTLLGDKKMAVFEDTNPTEPIKVYDTTLVYPKEEEPTGASFRLGDINIPRIKMADPLSIQLTHFIRYIEGKEKPLTPIENGVAVVSILEAINESMKTGNEIVMADWLAAHSS